jgi:cytochrome c
VSSSEPNLARGERLSLACQACHTFAVDGPHLLGPNLHGVFGRRAGSAAEFQYSPALEAADIVWTPETLDAWLADPVGYLPGTTMAFTGYQSPLDRRDLVFYLVNATK